MRKRTLMLIISAALALILLAGMTLDFGFPIERVTGYGFLSQDYRDKQLRDRYSLNFGLTKTPAGNITCYIPVYYETSEETVSRYTVLFKTFDADGSKDDDTFLCFSGDYGQLKIYRYVDGFIYNGYVSDGTDGTQLEDEKAAVTTALKYFENRYLPLGYEETKVRFSEGVYTIVFVKRLGNMKNYAYNNSVQLDEYGNLLQMNYYNIQYEPYQTCRIISMKDSYRSLPLDFAEYLPKNARSATAESPEAACILNSCELVYVFENSILQPAYYYLGEITSSGNPKVFECFIKAADYEDR